MANLGAVLEIDTSDDFDLSNNDFEIEFRIRGVSGLGPNGTIISKGSWFDENHSFDIAVQTYFII